MTTTDIESKALALRHVSLEDIPSAQEYLALVEEMRRKAAPIIEASEKIQEITTQDEQIEAMATWAQLDALEKAAKPITAPLKDVTNKLHKAATTLDGGLVDPISAARKRLKFLMGQWEEKQKRLREAEEKRIENELRAREEERLLQEAIEAEGLGLKEESHAILDEPVVVPTVTLPKTTPKVEGLVFSERWHAEVHDLMALVRAVAAGNAPLNFLVADMVSLNKQAQSLKSNLNIPGVKAVSRRV